MDFCLGSRASGRMVSVSGEVFVFPVRLCLMESAGGGTGNSGAAGLAGLTLLHQMERLLLGK